MRKPATKPPSPPKLNLRRIDVRLRLLDATGWFKELSKLYKLSVIHDLGLHKVHPAIYRNPSGNKTDTVIIPLPTVQFLGPHREGYWLEKERLPALIVNLDASDLTIFNALKCVLRAYRKHWNPTVANPGRYNLKSEFGERTFKKWRAERIVPLAYLLAWRATLNARDARAYPDHKLGSIVGKGSARQTSEAKGTLRGALKRLPALAAKLAQDDPSNEDADEVTAAWVAKQI